MSDSNNFVGFWKVLDCAPMAVPIDTKGIQGTVFQLTSKGDVTWKVPEDAVPSPLFKCDTYEVVPKIPYLANCILRFGAYKGYIIDCTVKTCEPYVGVISMDDGWCLLLCKKFDYVNPKDPFELPFSLLPALQDSYFSDLTIKAKNNKEFHVHTSILKLSAPKINWLDNPSPLSNLSEDVTSIILHFLYAQCLPTVLEEDTVKNVISVVSEMPGLETLTSLCQIYLKNTALKRQIFTLVADMHACASQIIENFTNNHSNSENLASDPAKLCFAVKNSIREAAVAGSKLLLICDLYTKQKHTLSIEEEHEIIHHVKSRIPVFVNQLECFLQALKVIISNLLPSQRQELACYLVPEVETIFDTVLSLLIKVKILLEGILSEMEEETNFSKMLENLEQYTDNVLHGKELAILGGVITRITTILMYLHPKKDYFKVMTSGHKIRSVVKSLEELMEDLLFFVSWVDGMTSNLEEKLHWNESQFCFKVGSAKVSEAIKRLLPHKNSLQDVLVELCELVQRDSFTQSLVALGLMDSPTSTAVNSSERRQVETSIQTTDGDHLPNSFNARNSICVSPPAHRNHLSKAASDLLKSGQETDMIFEVISSGESDGIVDHTEGVSVESETETNPQPEVFKMAAHRVIIAARCDWFRRALLSGMQEDINRKIQVHNTSPYLFSLFLEYLYSGRLDCLSLTVDQISELLLLSDRYELDSLKQICEYGLKSHLDDESVLYFFNMADRFNAKMLKSACEQFIAQHPEVLDSELFEQLPDNLQSEVYDVVICGKPLTIDVDLEKITTNSNYGAPDIEDMIAKVHINSNLPSPESDDVALPIQDSPRLETTLEQLREVVGPGVSRSQLIPVILAADFDVGWFSVISEVKKSS